MKKLIPEFVKRAYRKLLSFFANLYYLFPARGMVIIAVTGTSGKTTTSNLIYHLLKSTGFSVGIISTIGAKAQDTLIDTGFHVTTPDVVQLPKIIKQMKDSGVKFLVLETSSHALAQSRIGFLTFDYAVYTNIKRDHLDWHKTWEKYAEAKASLIRKLKSKGLIIVNRDDKDGFSFLNRYASRFNKKENLVPYSLNEVSKIQEEEFSIKFTLDNYLFTLPIIGSYNVENAMAAITLGTSLGIEMPAMVRALETFEGLEGRMQILKSSPFKVIVDFAHTTDALEKSLLSMRKLLGDNGKLINVFGSAGLRDLEKRFLMGEASGRLADITIITAEDPRTEKLYDINSEILRGAESANAKLAKRFANNADYQSFDINSIDKIPGNVYIFDEETVNSRFDAIDFAIKIAKQGDIVIAQGKGHEQSLCFGKTEYPFTDQEAVGKTLMRLEREEIINEGK